MTGPDEDMTGERAKVLYQGMLDTMGAAYESGDFALYLTAIAWPFTLSTVDRTLHARSEGDLRLIFDIFRKRLDQIGVTQFVRSCVAAQFHGPHTIEGTHVSSALRDGTYIEDPFPVTSIMHRRGAGWKAVSLQNALPDPSLFTQVMVESTRKIRPEGPETIRPEGPETTRD